jgi:DNA repair exonuclease SbcCD nuclease subunit
MTRGSEDRPVVLAHVSDTHLAFRQYPVNAHGSGRNQRERDVERAFQQATEDISAWDPPLVIHSGDVADKPIITYRHQLMVQHAFTQLTRRPDGSHRFVVVISGNHDMPRDPREPCYLDPALRPVPSVAVVTNKYVALDLAG